MTIIGLSMVFASLGMMLVLLLTFDTLRFEASMPAPTIEPPPTPPIPPAVPFLANPAALASTGSGRGRVNAFDAVRSLIGGFGVYGAAHAIVQAYLAMSAHPESLGTHGAEIVTAVNMAVAATTAIVHLLHAFTADNTPRPPATPANP